MARINVEESIFKDHRFFELGLKLGGIDAALGSMIRAWWVAQKYWLQNGVGIPLPVWKEQKLRPELLESGLAEVRGEFIYIRGSEEQFLWLKQKSDSGKKGGPAASNARVENIKKSGRRKSSKHDGARALYSSSSLSSLSPSSSSSSFSNTKSSDPGFSAEVRPATTVTVWESYSGAYKLRYGAAPVRNAMVNGQITSLVKRVGAEDAARVAEFYVAHNDSYYVKIMHSVGILLKDCEKLRTEWITGVRMMGSKAREIERIQSNADNWDEGARILNERRKSNEHEAV